MNLATPDRRGLFAREKDSMHDLTAVIGLGIFALLFVTIVVACLSVFRRNSTMIDGVLSDFEAAQQKSEEKDREKRIFELAGDQGGAVTALQAAGHTDMTIAEAAVYLEGLVKMGLATMDVDDSGTIIYRIISS